MLTLENKQCGPSGQRKPQRFNFGGLLKKNFVWKKSVNSLASTLSEVQLDYPIPSSISSTNNDDSFQANNTTKRHESYDSNSSTDLIPKIPSPKFESNYTTYPDYLNDKLVPRSENVGGASSSENSSDTPFNTECISLLNSDLTSEMNLDNVCDSYFCPSKPMTTEHGVLPWNEHSEEKITEYCVYGYHPVRIGDEFTSDISRYRVLRKLGWGHFSTVWLCYSLMSGQYVALKIVKLGKNYTEAALDEISILKLLQDDSKQLPEGKLPVVSLLDNFTIQGPNGTHVAMAFELMGENLLHLIFKKKKEKFKAMSSKATVSPYLLPIDTIKSIVFQLLKATDFMHRNSIIHTDLKPENILLTYCGEVLNDCYPEKAPKHFQILPSQPLRHCEGSGDSLELKVADLGNATFSNLHMSDHIQTRQYRAPEILMGHCWGALADVWSIGCLIFEFLTGDYLFEPTSGATFSKDEDHMAQIIELLGEFPSTQYSHDCTHFRKYFKDTNSLRNIQSLKFWSLQSVLEEKYKFDMEDENIKLICDLMLKCLHFDLDKRYDCGSLMAHPFFKKDAKFVQKECDELPNYNSRISGFTCEEHTCS